MSYDFYMAVDTGGAEPHYIEPWYDDEHPALGSDGIAGIAIAGGARCGNYPSNVSGMWMRCLTAAAEQTGDGLEWRGADARRWARERPDVEHYREKLHEYERHLCLRDLAGKTGGELAPLLRAAVEWGIAHLDELREGNPDNGWGDAEGAVTYLWDIQRMCEQHPRARLEISS